MIIVIDVDRFYDWVPVSDEELGGELTRAPDEYRPAADGTLLRRQLVDMPSYTTVSIPLAQTQVLVDASMYPHITDVRRAIASWLEERVMPSHAPRDAWTGIHVDHDEDLEEWLTNYFQLTPDTPAAPTSSEEPL